MKLITKQLEGELKKYPYLSQDGKGRQAKVIAKFFGGSSFTALITEADFTESGLCLYGYIDIGYGFEFGGITLPELESWRFKPFNLGVERDLWIGKEAIVADFIDEQDFMFI